MNAEPRPSSTDAVLNPQVAEKHTQIGGEDRRLFEAVEIILPFCGGKLVKMSLFVRPAERSTEPLPATSVYSRSRGKRTRRRHASKSFAV